MIFSKTRASALLLSFFMMTMLIMLSLGVSFLIIRDVSTVRTVVAGAQARYAAEGASEIGLHVLKESLPGYEPELDFEFSNAVLASLDVEARGDVVPCSGEWGMLGANESVQLPLFAQVDANGALEDVQSFYVEFYVGLEDGSLPLRRIGTDVLRWKILGFDNGETEAISEYIPLDGERITPEYPSIFGTILESAVPAEYTTAKFNEKIGNKNYVFHSSYPIEMFLGNHEANYLVLTNVVQGSSEYKIFYRLHSTQAKVVCSYVTLDSSAEMEFGSARQSLDTVVREGENLPVYDFVLYHTDGEKEE